MHTIMTQTFTDRTGTSFGAQTHNPSSTRPRSNEHPSVEISTSFISLFPTCNTLAEDNNTARQHGQDSRGNTRPTVASDMEDICQVNGSALPDSSHSAIRNATILSRSHLRQVLDEREGYSSSDNYLSRSFPQIVSDNPLVQRS